MLDPAIIGQAGEHDGVADLHDLAPASRPRCAGWLALVFLERGEACRDNAGIGAEANGARKVDRAVERAPVVDSVKYREVAGDVLLVVKYPINLCTPLL